MINQIGSFILIFNFPHTEDIHDSFSDPQLVSQDLLLHSIHSEVDEPLLGDDTYHGTDKTYTHIHVVLIYWPTGLRGRRMQRQGRLPTGFLPDTNRPMTCIALLELLPFE
jgi:hypothetical protein